MSVLVLSKTGNQVPVILLSDDGGNVNRVSPEQIGEGVTNVGVTFVLMVTSIATRGLSQVPIDWLT